MISIKYTNFKAQISIIIKRGGAMSENTINLMAFPNPDMSILPEGVPKWWPDRNSRKEGARVVCQGAEIEIIYCAYEKLYSNICNEYWWLGKMITRISRFNLHTRSAGQRRGWTMDDWWQSHGLYLRVAWWVLFVREAIPNKQKVKYKVLNKGSLGESSHFYFPQATTMSQRSKVGVWRLMKR